MMRYVFTSGIGVEETIVLKQNTLNLKNFPFDGNNDINFTVRRKIPYNMPIPQGFWEWLSQQPL